MPWAVHSGGWVTETITLTTASGAVSLASTTIDNTAGAWDRLEVELVLTSFDPGTLRAVELHMQARLTDGSTYPDAYVGGPTVVPSGVQRLTSGGSVKNLMWTAARGDAIFLPPLMCRLGIGNLSSNSLGGGTLKTRRIKWIA